MEFSVLASGSSGNCFYVSDKKNGILVDAGISCKQVCERLTSLGKDVSDIKGIFITHEHADHLRGAEVLHKHFNIPIYGTHETLENSGIKFKGIEKNDSVSIGNMKIESFSKNHKAANPVSYKIKEKKKTISVITDLGFVCKNTQEAINHSDFLCLESNHDIKMLENGPYPFFLKKWIRSDIGHLSNTQASLGVLEFAKPTLQTAVLAHLSENNNNPAVAKKSFSSLIKERSDLKPKIFVAQHAELSPLFEI